MMALEIERKYLNVDFDALRSVLESRGAFCQGVHFEQNTLFDTSGNELFLNDCLLRLRTQEWLDEKRYLLTLKLPHAPQKGFKVRDEREVEIADGAGMAAILQGLGYAVAARYEKVREIWILNSVEVCLDVLPFLTALELEGDPICLLQVAAWLKVNDKPASVESYNDLHQAWRRRHNMPQEHSFVFNEEQRFFWRKKLGLGLEA